MRGVAGEYPLDRFTTYCVGACACDSGCAERSGPTEVVIGMDTRESGPWIAEHVAGGLRAQQIRPHFAGLITTPGLAHVTRTGPFAAGVMISASHNPYQDNGIKIIDHSGFKLPDEQEAYSGARYRSVSFDRRRPRNRRRSTADEGLDREYIEHLASTMTRDLSGMQIVADGANGAASYLAPALFRTAGRGHRVHPLRARRPQHQPQLRIAAPRRPAGESARDRRRSGRGFRRRRRPRAVRFAFRQNRRWRRGLLPARPAAASARDA